MIENFNTYIQHIEPDFWRDLCINEGALRHYDRGEEFVHVGDVARYIGFIRSGTLKYVAYSADGTEHVVGMVFEGGFVADLLFSLSDLPAKVSIIVETGCDIYCYPTKDLIKLIKTDESVEAIYNRTIEAVFSTVYDRYIDLYCASPQQRYSDLVMRHPDLFSLYSLKDIASFLNITPTHLSRLRKNSGNHD